MSQMLMKTKQTGSILPYESYESIPW